jgi:branched-chain amino acid transport system substrate-binding protein
MTVTQIVLNPFIGTLPTVRDYKTQTKQYTPKDARLGTLSLEGLRQTPRPVTVAGLRDVLVQRDPFDLGSLKATFTKNDHVGLDFLDISIVTFGGRLRY